MMTEDSQSTEKSIYEPDDFAFVEMWQALSFSQQRFAIAMLECPTKKDAALAVGIQPDTVYRWPNIVDDVVDRLLENAAMSAYEILEASVVKAAGVKRAGLDSDDAKLRQDVSSEILDRILGRAKQRLEHTGEGGGPIEHMEVGLDAKERNRALAALADAIADVVCAAGGTGDGTVGTSEQDTVAGSAEFC